jgi:hypothetical protein
MPRSQTSLRVQRVKATLRETRDARGWMTALMLLCRILLTKGPLLLRQMRATRKVETVRRSVAEGRADLVTDDPYLAFFLTGGLGDYVVIARFVRDLAAQVGSIKFDLFSPNPTLAAWAFARIPGFRGAYHDILFDHVVHEYDVGFRVNQFAVVYQEHVRWSSVREHHGLMRAIDRLVRFRPKIEMFVDRHPLLDNFLARTAVFENANRRDFLHLMAGLPYGGDRLPMRQDAGVVSRMGLRPQQYITVHNGFDTGFVITGRRATKCYPHFGAVVAQIRTAFPDLQVVQIGTTTSEPIAECDLVLLNKTSLDEVVGLLAQSVLHLDNEGGLVHLAACVGTRSVVVFGPTPSEYFGYAGNINIDPPVCGNCWWMTRTWMDVCAKGYSVPRCMAEQAPEVVAEYAMKAIAEAGFDPSDDMLESAVASSNLGLTRVASE